MANSALDAVVGSGTSPARSNSAPLCTRSVASPPSSRIMFGPSSPPERTGHVIICSVHHQYSSSVSPFQANTGMPWGISGVPFGPMATAAAAWSCVEKMLHEAHRTSAPSSTSVSMSTAVWIVMCSEPEMRAPASGLAGAVLLAQGAQAGHLVLGQVDLAPPERGEREVGDTEVVARPARSIAGGHGRRVYDGSREPARAPAPLLMSRNRAKGARSST